MQKLKQELKANPVGATIGRPHFKEMTIKNQKGITLIALIITIIVMLILVGVTINVALNGGLFDKAETAKTQTQLAVDREELQMAVIAALNNDREIPNAVVIKNNLQEGWEVTGDDGGLYTCTSPNGNVFTVDNKGNIESGGTGNEPPVAFKWSDVHLTVDTNVDYICEPAPGLEFLMNFTDKGKIIIKSNGKTVIDLDATDLTKRDEEGYLKFEFSLDIEEIGTDEAVLKMNGVNIDANLINKKQTFTYVKKTEEPLAKDSVYGPTYGAYVVLTAEGEIISINREGISDQYSKYEIYGGSITELANTYTQYQEHTIDDGLKSKSLNKFIIGYKEVQDTTTQGVIVGALDGNNMWVIAINGKNITYVVESFTLNSSLTLEDVLPNE